MKLLIGLGNPGPKYRLNRHNFGFLALDHIASKLDAQFSNKSTFNAEVAFASFQGHKIALLKPQTYMNLSGESVAKFINYYKISSENIFVIYDDIDIPLGVIKHKIGGGSAGHNGIKSIDAHIGNTYHKIRLGVGRPENQNIEVADYVLSNFSDTEIEGVERVLVKLCSDLNSLIIS